MVRSEVDEILQESFGHFYTESQKAVNRRIEKDVCGCDYGGVSWATREEIDKVAELLNLRPGDQLMDIGAGSGWPGLYLGAVSGCDVMLTDLPIEGLIIAAKRAKSERLSGACHIAVAEGENLPCKDKTYHALTHSDVLCCLDNKLAVLRECRRVIRADGQMIFSVIYMDGGLNKADRAKTIDAGPPYVGSIAPYEELLMKTGWRLKSKDDRTAEYLSSIKTFFKSSEDNQLDLVNEIGFEEFTARMSREQGLIDCLERGLLKRALYQVEPTSR